MQLGRSARSHPGVLTALDILIIVSLATGVVMLLGARDRFLVGGVLVSMTRPLRPLIFGLVAAVVRLWVGRGHPLLPSLRLASIGPSLERERQQFADPPRVTREVKYYALAAALGSMLWLTPHLLNPRLVPDVGDPIFSAWRLARFSHQLVTNPARLFDGNIFHPAPYTLTYSDATVLEGLAAFPFIVSGADPLIVSNAVFLASFPLCALAFFYAAWRFTGDAQAACIAGILGGLSAFKFEHYSHLELQFFCFAPLSIITLLRMLAAPGWRSGALFGLAVTAQWLACMYLGVMLFVFLAPCALLAAAAWRVRPTRALGVAVVTGGTIMVVGVSVVAIPYLRSQSQRGERTTDIVKFYSARPADYGAAHSRLATYDALISRADNQPERELFPGTLPFLLGAIGMVPPMSLGTIVLVSGAAASFDGSLGFNGLIYDELYTYVLPFRAMRVPARFAALVGTGLVLLGAYGARRVLSLGRTPATRGIIFIVLAAGALVDLRPAVQLEPYFDTIPSVYSAVTPEMVLAELPMEGVANFSFMYFSTFHRARLINGHSGYMPASYIDLERDMEHFPERNVMTRLRQRGATHLTVNCALLSKPRRCPKLLETLDGMSGELEMISSGKWEGSDVRLYMLR